MTMSSGEFMNTLTGFEELAIKSMAGVPLDELLGDRKLGLPVQYSLLTRCLAAVKTMREEPGVKLVEAYGRAQKLSRTELAEVFNEAEAEDDAALDAAAGEPVTESGKDGEQTPEPPASSPSSASEPA
jgi:hypothetical protein